MWVISPNSLVSLSGKGMGLGAGCYDRGLESISRRLGRDVGSLGRFTALARQDCLGPKPRMETHSSSQLRHNLQEGPSGEEEPGTCVIV